MGRATGSGAEGAKAGTGGLRSGPRGAAPREALAWFPWELGKGRG